MPIFGAPPGGLETWVRVEGPDSRLRDAVASVFGEPTGYIVFRKSGCRISAVSPEFATEQEAIDFAADVPVPAAPTRLVDRS